MPSDALRPGDLVDVKSASEILATLDAEGALEALPFMAEMLPWCGRRFVVDKRADKICDTIEYSGSRRLRDTVLLANLRCDGSGHDGCQAECRLFWKEAWLRRVEPGDPAPAADSADAREALRGVAERNARRGARGDGRADQGYRCQATELYRASERLRLSDPRPYLRVLATGDVGLRRFLRVMARAAVQELRHKLGLKPQAPLAGTRTAERPDLPLDLRPGEWVRVKSRPEIAKTLNVKGKNRGLWFDWEMLPHCGKTFRVRQRVRWFIDDQTGRMVELKTDCVTLEGAFCSGDHSLGRWFCPRAIYPYWRETWLERVSGSEAQPKPSPTAGEARLQEGGSE